MNIETAKAKLEKHLNYGGVFVDGMHTTKHISVEAEQGDPKLEAEQLERIAEAFSDFALALKTQG
jgi:hypothetical protein